MTDAITIHDRLKDQFLRYYNTPFAVRDEAVVEERTRLLRADRGICREPWLEPIAPYSLVDMDLTEACTEAGAHDDLARFSKLGLLPDSARLYLHQFQALRASCSEDKHVIVTAGTGSGKTEAFLLPLFSHLLQESETWGSNGRPSGNEWWLGDKPRFEAQRDHENGRDAAVRALILYPMNALVDDQLKRLREALDSAAASLDSPVTPRRV